MLTRIIGIGSPFGADRLGWLAIDYLQQHTELCSSAVRLYKFDRPGAGLIEKMHQCDRMIILDAMRGDEDGKVICIPADTGFVVRELVSTHGFALVECIELARALGELPEQCYVCGISMKEPSIQDIPDEWLQQLVNQVAELLVVETPATIL